MRDAFRLIVKDDAPFDMARFKRSLAIAGADALLVALALFAFFYIRYGAAHTQPGVGIVSPREGSPYVVTPDFTSADNGGARGMFSFDGRFLHDTPTEIQAGDTLYYYDSGCEIALTTYFLATGRAIVADVYVSDISRLSTALANDTYGKGQRERPAEIAARNDALFYLPGDNYSERFGGAVMRNGVLYAREPYRDSCVLYWDGTVEIYSRHEFNLADVMANNPYQIWSFGPALLLDGEAPDHYDTDLHAPMPRAAFGYFEPGHYCFVVMEGDVLLTDLTRTMQTLGCESAYALYGGRHARMNFGEYDDAEEERPCSDIILITK
ncbi:MAG: phosphodiester glycosidase family protein [Christensenellales bacterium]|jgi:hypothetical protein